MNSAEQMYAVGLNDIVDTLMDTGTDVTYLIQGHMGTGLSLIHISEPTRQP